MDVINLGQNQKIKKLSETELRELWVLYLEDKEKNKALRDTLIIQYISDTEDGKYNSAMRRLAQHYQNGAKKYAKNNWRKGQPISRYYDSAMRHL